MTYSILLSSHRLLKVLYILGIAAVVLAAVYPGFCSRWFGAIERGLRRIAARRARAVLFAAFFPMAVRLVMLPLYPPPPPQIHDEFSYLLQGDTFAHGRVVNPTPPYWKHFETEYTLFEPHYASQYQPAQGVVLAIGQRLTGSPWVGVWLSVGLMCGALCWALWEIVPPIWALAGALGAALQFGIYGLWMNSYFGGAVAATGGCLIAWALARLSRNRGVASAGAVCGLGMVILFATRPFEALVWAMVAAVFAVYYGFRKRIPIVRLLPAFALVFAAGAATLAWYNYRVTGSALDPPYLAYQRVYGTPQPYWWQKPKPIDVDTFDFPEIRDNYLNQLHLYEQRYSASEVFEAERVRLRNFWKFFIGPFFTPGLIFLPWVIRSRRMRPWLLASIPFIAAKASYHAWYPAHSAPETILVVLVVLESWRHLRAAGRRRRTGVAITRTLVLATCLTIVLANLGRAVEPALIARGLRHWPPIWESLYPARRLRDDVSGYLEQIPGKHLLFVKYAPGHCFCEEWVFNLADLKEQRIIYARPFTPKTDVELARSFPDFNVWVIEPDERPYRLVRLTSTFEISLIAQPEY